MRMPQGYSSACLALGLTLGMAGGAMAQSNQAEGQEDRFDLGSTPSEELVRAWNIDISPDGDNLPEGSGSVMMGKRVYQQRCMACHGERGRSAAMDLLVGGRGSLDTEDPVKTVGSYWPYATTLYDYIHRAMPFNAPQSLSAEQVYAVTAYVLYLNGIVSEDAVMDKDSLPKVRMPNRGGFKQTDTLTTATTKACMTDCTPLDVSMPGTSPTRIQEEQIQ